MDSLATVDCRSNPEPKDVGVPLGTPAWLAEYAYQRYLAFSAQAAVEVIERPLVIDIPGSTYYARGLMKWQGRWVPVIDMQDLLRAYASQSNSPLRYALIVAYQTAPYRPIQYGALAVSAPPTMVYVNDDQVAPLPSDSDLWPLIALSCFQHDNKPVPIVDWGGLFRASFD